MWVMTLYRGDMKWGIQETAHVTSHWHVHHNHARRYCDDVHVHATYVL